MKRVFRYWLFMLAVSCASAMSHAQSTSSKEQLDQMLAPVALYPDPLLSQLLMASTYPDDVAAAAKWSSGHQALQGDEAVKAAQDQPWDPSVTSLTAFPSVLDMMGRQPDWVQSVGDAFLDQPDDVMASVQRLRAQARDAGNLASNEQQTVATKTEEGNTYVSIQPASQTVVYVPAYNPATTYGTWPYPASPPAYYPPPPGSVFASALISGLAFGTGIAIANSLWGDVDWGHGDVDIDVNRYNNINVNKKLDASRQNVNWQHDPARRGETPYRGSATQQRFNQQRTTALQAQGRGTATGQGGTPRVGAQPRSAADQQARREHAQQVMRERGSAGQAERAGAPRTGTPRTTQRTDTPRAGADRRAGVEAGAGARRPSSPSATSGLHQPSAAATSRGQSREAALARSREQNRDNALRDVNTTPRQIQQASRPAPGFQQNRAAPRNTGGGRQIDRGRGGRR